MGRLRSMSGSLRAAAGLAAAIALGAPGCQEPKGERAGPRFDPGTLATPGTGPVIDARWPFWPTRMRIHPLSLLSTDRDTGEPIIEARIEMLDQFGDTTKCVAQFRFELHDGRPATDDAPPMRIWNVDLRDPDRNRLHFDRVTQTYLFRLSLQDLPARERESHLRVFVLSVTGRQFADAARVR